MFSFIYSGLCINSEARCNIVLIILSSGRMTWPLHVDLCYPHEVNGSPSYSGLYTNFSVIIYYIFVEKQLQYEGCMFCHSASDPECVSVHKFNYHCSLYFMMFCNVLLFVWAYDFRLIKVQLNQLRFNYLSKKSWQL